MSLRLKVYCALAALALLAAMAGASLLGDLAGAAPRLVVEDRRTGRVILSQPVVPGARLSVAHRNHFSGARVTDVFEVGADGGLIAREPGSKPRWEGPAAPPSGRAGVTDEPIRRRDPARVGGLSVIVHPHTEHRLEVGGRVVDLSATLPAGTHVWIAIHRP